MARGGHERRPWFGGFGWSLEKNRAFGNGGYGNFLSVPLALPIRRRKTVSLPVRQAGFRKPKPTRSERPAPNTPGNPHHLTNRATGCAASGWQQRQGDSRRIRHQENPQEVTRAFSSRSTGQSQPPAAGMTPACGKQYLSKRRNLPVFCRPLPPFHLFHPAYHTKM